MDDEIFTDERTEKYNELLALSNNYINDAKVTDNKESRISLRIQAIKTLNIIINSVDYNRNVMHCFGALLYEILIENDVKSSLFYTKCIDTLIKVVENDPFDTGTKNSIEKAITDLYTFFDSLLNIKLIKDAINVIPESISLNIIIALLYTKVHNIDKALYHNKLALCLNKATEDKNIKKDNDITIYNNIYNIFIDRNLKEIALKYMIEAASLYENDPHINLNLGSVYTLIKNNDLPLQFFKRALENCLNTNLCEQNKLLSHIYCNMAFYYATKPDFELEIKYAKLSYELKPTIETLRCILMSLNYQYHSDKMFVLHEHLKVNNFFNRCKPYTFDSNFFNTEKINIGIVSGDILNGHAVYYFIKTFINGYNKDKFTLTCYSENHIDGCKSLIGLSAKEGSDLIYNDKIHILFDLSGHTTYSRLDIFANKPSPIQITWIGYPFTTGVKEIDYRITDNICDNKNSECYYTEKLLYLDNCFLCYEPAAIVPIVNSQRENLVIGCFNRPNKMSEQFINMCNNILHRYPNVILKFNSQTFIDNDIFQKFLSKFEHKDRVFNIESPRTLQGHLVTYNEVDICLDTFPYSGTTTTCESLQMGVPVLTIYNPENFHVSNVTSSILKNSNLDFFVCSDEEDLIQKLDNLHIDKNKIQNCFLNGIVCNKKLHLKNLEGILERLYHDIKLLE